eukprot:scaffold3662_cov388-Prasinococcus_capsulatus_cf.AAC.6
MTIHGLGKVVDCDTERQTNLFTCKAKRLCQQECHHGDANPKHVYIADSNGMQSDPPSSLH